MVGEGSDAGGVEEGGDAVGEATSSPDLTMGRGGMLGKGQREGGVLDPAASSPDLAWERDAGRRMANNRRSAPVEGGPRQRRGLCRPEGGISRRRATDHIGQRTTTLARSFARI